MILWFVLTLLIVLAAVGLVIPLVRPRAASEGGSTAVGILKSQLAELEGQRLAGTVDDAEAGRLKLEIERRLLAEARTEEAPSRPLGEKALTRLAFGIAAVVVLGAAGLYALMGKPETPSAPAPAQTAAGATGDHPTGDLPAMILQLQTQVQANPDDAEGWRLLGWSYFQTGAFSEAAVAYGRASVLQPSNGSHASAQGEALVQAAGGQVTPAAAAAFQTALRADPADPRARYFLAVQKDQSGDQAGAMADWIEIINSAPADAPWAGEVRRFVEDLARERGIDLTGRLKPASAGAAPGPMAGTPGPTPDQVAAAQSMSPEDRNAMVQGMVAGLESRLQANPRDVEGWVRLMRARMVLGETDAATRAYRSGRAAFNGDAASQGQLAEAARGLGVPGA